MRLFPSVVALATAWLVWMLPSVAHARSPPRTVRSDIEIAAFIKPPDAPARRVGTLKATAKDSPPGGTVVVHMQHASPDRTRIASLNPEAPSILLSDPDGAPRQSIDLGTMKGIAGFRWLQSSEGLAVWTLDAVYVVPIDGTHPPSVVYEVDQPGGQPLAIEDVRAVPDGLFVVAQACGDQRVVREAGVVHLVGTQLESRTSLAPWSGETLYAATAMRDGTVVLALNEPEHVRSAFLQCVARDTTASQKMRSKGCWFMTLPTRFFASEFRVLEVHRSGIVKVVGQHACPYSNGCLVDNWAHGPNELLWSDRRHIHRLRSAIQDDPFMPSGGLWGTAKASGPGALWLRGGRVLSTGGADVTLRDLKGTPVLPRRTLDDTVESARFRPDGSGAVLALRSKIIDLDFATNEARVVFDRLDVPVAFDVRYDVVAFSDAALHVSGTLTFDVTARDVRAAAGQLRVVQDYKTLFVGQWNEGCESAVPAAPGRRRSLDQLLDDPVSSYRKLGHLTKTQRQ